METDYEKEQQAELEKHASLGRVANTTEVIYVSSNKKYNILNEELKKELSRILEKGE